MTVLVVLVAVLLLAVALGGLALLVRPPEEVVRTYPGVTRLRVRLGAGRVEVAEDDRPDARLELLVRRRPGLGRPLVTRHGDVLDVDARASQARVSARLPRGTAVRAEVHDGEISLWGSAGELELLAGSGSVAGRELSGPRVVARSGGGDVVLHFDAPPGRLSAHAQAGDVRLVVPDDTYAVDVTAGDLSRARVEVAHDDQAPRRLAAASPAGSVTVLPASAPARL